MPKDKDDDLAPSPHEISNAVEILGNVLYLIEHGIERPEEILTYLSIAQRAMEILRVAALNAQLWASGRRTNLFHLPDGQAVEHTDPPPIVIPSSTQELSPDDRRENHEID